jgi:hypothetical protein
VICINSFISCDTSQAQMFWWIFIFILAMGHLVGLSPKTLWNPPSPSRNFYFYIVLHNCIEFISVCFTLVLIYRRVKHISVFILTLSLFYKA